PHPQAPAPRRSRRVRAAAGRDRRSARAAPARARHRATQVSVVPPRTRGPLTGVVTGYGDCMGTASPSPLLIRRSGELTLALDSSRAVSLDEREAIMNTNGRMHDLSAWANDHLPA